MKRKKKSAPPLLHPCNTLAYPPGVPQWALRIMSLISSKKNEANVLKIQSRQTWSKWEVLWCLVLKPPPVLDRPA